MSDLIPLTLTKLHPPLPRRATLQRERLTSLVSQCVERRLTLVGGGAGCGKTTLLASSLAEMQLPLIWYSLSRSDRDLITFLAYLTAGIDRQWPGFAAAMRPAFSPGKDVQAQPVAAVSALINELASVATADFLIVLDDFQLVDQVPEICQALEQLLCYAPAQAHFVLATRVAASIPSLARLRAEGEVLEIGAADLKFTPDETTALFEQCLNLSLPESVTATLVERTEGWVLGLLLAGQTIKGRGHVEMSDSLPEPAVDRRVLFEYLTEEILRQHPPAVVDFLTSSAILSRLEPTACDAALGRSDSAHKLLYLEQQCLFVVRTEDGWLRYHRLFREFLLQQLAGDPERLETLHRRAAAYFEERQDFESAIFHWLEAGAFRPAALLIASTARELLHAGRLDTLGLWLSRLPRHVFVEFPELWFRWGQLCEAAGQWDQALEHYERAIRSFTERGDLLGLSDVLRRKGHILDWRKGKHAEAERLHREALSYVGEEHRRKRAALLSSLSRNQLSAGNPRTALVLYREALAIYESEADRPGQLATLLNPGSWLYHSLGDFSQALGILRRAEQLASDLNSRHQLAEVYNNMAVNLYFLERAAESLHYAEKALALSRELGDTHNEAYALMNQANALEATCGASYTHLYGQSQRALHMQQALGNQRFTIATLVFMMSLARRGGEASEAVRRGLQALPLAAERGLRWLTGFVLIQLGAAQIEIDPAAARASLKEALQIFTDCEDLYHLTGAHFWLAALYHYENKPVYLDHLRECLRLAVGHHYDYFFPGEAQAAIPLLVAALEHDLWPSYVAAALVKIGPRTVSSLRPLLSHVDVEVQQRAQAVLDEIGAGATRPTAARHVALADTPLLTIRCFGNFRVRYGPNFIEERKWGRRKCKRLFKYVVLSPEHTLAKDEAIDLLWGAAAPQAAADNFYRTLYNLRRALAPQAPHSGANYLILEGGLLRLNAEAVESIDVDEFVSNVEEGRRLARMGDHTAAWGWLAAAVRLYTGDLATDDLYDDWMLSRRARLRSLYLGALSDLADMALEAGELDLAADYLRKIFGEDNTSEVACLNLMLCLAQIGHRAEALQHYTSCEQALAELDLSPSAELRAAQRDLLTAHTPLYTSSSLSTAIINYTHPAS